MANHCWNYAVFTGSESALQKLIDNLNKVREDFIKEHRPLPEQQAWIYGQNGHIVALIEEPPIVDGLFSIDPYDAYGSKWYECDWEVEEDDGKIKSVTLQGSSAWSPAHPLFEKICINYGLSCWGNYDESGMDFAGDFEITPNGTTTHNEMTYRQYMATNHPEAFWEDRVNDIVDGAYDSFEDVLADFEHVDWTLTMAEQSELEQLFNKD